MKRLMPPLAALLALSCSKSHSNEQDAANPAEDAGCVPDSDHPCPISNSCEGVWSPGPLTRPWWNDEAPATCRVDLAHVPDEYYDDCGADSLHLPPEQCDAPNVGAVYCEPSGRVWEGRLTTSCLVPSDCPSGMTCVFGGVPTDVVPLDPLIVWAGHCEKRCDPSAGPKDCIRCDLECDPEHSVCGVRTADPPDPYPCKADCQCVAAQVGGNVCLEGACEDVGQAPNGICGLDCACDGGTCGEDRCCYLPDGSIAEAWSAVCRPDEAH